MNVKKCRKTFTKKKLYMQLLQNGFQPIVDSRLGFLTLYHVCVCGGGGLDVISCQSVVDAPTNSKFLDFSQFDPYFHLVKSFFNSFCNFLKKHTVKIFFALKKNNFFTKMIKNIFFSQILAFFVSNT